MPVLKHTKHTHLKNKQKILSNIDVSLFQSVQDIIASQNKSNIFLITGPKNSGKSALGHIIVNRYSPSMIISSSEISASSLSNPLNSFLRQCVRIQIHEEISILCGEIYDLREQKLCLRTTDVESEFSVSPKIYDELLKLNVSQGDVIKINKSNGTVQRLGKTFIRQNEAHLVGPDDKIVDLPQGELIKNEEVVISMTLNELDCLTENAKKGIPFLLSESFYSGDLHSQRLTDSKIHEWVDEGLAVIQKGALVIEDSELLDEPSLCLLNTLIQSPLAPYVILITNNNVESSNEPLKNFYSKYLTIRTKEFTQDDKQYILSSFLETFSDDERNTISFEEAMSIVQKYELKHAFNLITQCIVSRDYVNSTKISDIFKDINSYS